MLEKKLSLPTKNDLSIQLTKVIYTLSNELTTYRPSDKNNKPGGLLSLQKKIPVVLVPDIHSRYSFLQKVLNYEVFPNESVLDLLKKQQIYLIFVGDGLHSERRGKERWLKAFNLFMKEDYVNSFLTEEMQEGLSSMILVMECKASYPENFHFLKGNHENILNEDTNGNHPFRKFALEGEMVKRFMIETYGKDITQLYSDFERLLPLFVHGYNFLVSHAEPKISLSRNEIINGMNNDVIVNNFTWTKNDDSNGDAVKKMLVDFLPNDKRTRYFSGHRPVEGLYNLRADGKLIQFHNPDKTEICIIKPDTVFNENTDIIEI